MTEAQAKAEFAELSPWFVNGTLDDRQYARVEQYLKNHPEAASELRWLQSFQSQVKSSAEVISPELGLETLLGRIKARKHIERPNLLSRVSEFISTLVRKPAFAFASVAVFVAQSAVITSLMMSERRDTADNAVQVRAVPTPTGNAEAVLQVNFRPDSTETEIRMLMISINGTIVGGPGQLGNYLVKVSPEKIQSVADVLGKDKHVDAVSILPNIPVRSE